MLSYSVPCQALNKELHTYSRHNSPSQLLQEKILLPSFYRCSNREVLRGPKRLSNSAYNTVTRALRFKLRSNFKSLALDPQRSHRQLASKAKLTKRFGSRELKKLEISVSQGPAAVGNSGSKGTLSLDKMLTFKWDKIVVTCLLNKFPDLFKVDQALRNTGMIAGDLSSPSHSTSVPRM